MVTYRHAERGPEPEPERTEAPPELVGPPTPYQLLNARHGRAIREAAAKMEIAKAAALAKALAAMDELDRRHNAMPEQAERIEEGVAVATAPEKFIPPQIPGIFYGIPDTQYRGSEGLSKSALSWALVSGQHYHYYQVQKRDQQQTAPLREGRILHKIVLELDDFARVYAVEPEWPQDAIDGAEAMKALIVAHNDKLPVRPPVEDLIAAIEAFNNRLPSPVDVGKTVAEHEVAYTQIPEVYQTLGEDDKRTGAALKACIKAYNDTLPKPLRTSGSYMAVLESYALTGADHAEQAKAIMGAPTPLPLNGTKAEMMERIKTFAPDTVFLDELKAAFLETVGEREIVTHNEYIHAMRYREAVLDHPEAALLLDEGVAESSIYWRCKHTGAVLKCRPDWMRPDHVMADMKFVRDASPTGFARDAAAHLYHMQDAHYSEGYHEATGHRPSFAFIAVSKDGPLGRDVFKPIVVAVYYYDEEDRARALDLRNVAVQRVMRWERDQYWPGHDGVHKISVPAHIANAERKVIELELSGDDVLTVPPDDTDLVSIQGAAITHDPADQSDEAWLNFD